MHMQHGGGEWREWLRPRRRAGSAETGAGQGEAGAGGLPLGFMSAGGDGSRLSVSLVPLRLLPAPARATGEARESGEGKETREDGTVSGGGNEQSEAQHVRAPVFARAEDGDDDAISPLLPWADASSSSEEVPRSNSAPSSFPRASSSSSQLTPPWQRLLHCVYGSRYFRIFVQIGSVLQWCMFNVIMILVNNEIFQRFGFTFPLTLTTIHFVISFLGALIAIEMLRVRPKAAIDSGALTRWVLPMAAVTCFNVVLAQLSVRYIPLHTLLLTKALSPGLTVIIQAVALGSEFDPGVCASLLPVMGGMVMAYAPGAKDQLAGDFMLFFSALGSVVLGCATVVCAEVLLQEQAFNLDSINALYHMVPYSALILAPPALLLEGQDLLKWLIALQNPVPAFAAILVSGFFAFCLNYALFYTIQKTSALTFNVAGNLKMAVSIVFAGLLFRAPMTQHAVAGCVVVLAGVGLYGWALYRVRRQRLEMSRTDSERMRLRDEFKEENVDVYLGAML